MLRPAHEAAADQVRVSEARAGDDRDLVRAVAGRGRDRGRQGRGRGSE